MSVLILRAKREQPSIPVDPLRKNLIEEVTKQSGKQHVFVQAISRVDISDQFMLMTAALSTYSSTE